MEVINADKWLVNKGCFVLCGRQLEVILYIRQHLMKLFTQQVRSLEAKLLLQIFSSLSLPLHITTVFISPFLFFLRQLSVPFFRFPRQIYYLVIQPMVVNVVSYCLTGCLSKKMHHSGGTGVW